MTIKRKRVSSAGLVEVEADSTDTVDTNGTSDTISTIGSQTAKFSNSNVMQANTGLLLGILQLTVNSGSVEARTGTIIVGAYGSVSTSPVTVDFGDIQTANASATVRHATSGTMTSVFELSTDNIIWTQVDTNVTSNDTTFTYSGNGETYRYARVRFTAGNNFLIVTIIDETALSSTATYNIRSSASQNTNDGTILFTDTIIAGSSKTLDIELFLTGVGEFFTLQVVSYTTGNFDLSLSDITSIREE